ncbi:hypothetical protein C2845_PM10G12360 [Panicum miliaceum]|uniref:Myb-like domain-containing protein n=1 Tax=Panicum miliaceum TaxID=4540 RepID=A0A3L6PJ15_PANMI|nr:hypothetical protein C2845_PM10G12360 [Panicum miliaceum]
MARHKEPSIPAAGGTPWKGRLRSHHATPQSLFSRRLPSCAKNRGEAEEPQTAKKPAAPKNTRRCGGCRAEDAEAARVPRAPPRRSPRLAGRDLEHPIVIDEGIKECEVRDNQSAITPLRRSPRFHPAGNSLGKQLLPQSPPEVTHNRKTPNASGKDKNITNLRSSQRNAAAKALPRTKSYKEPQPLCSNCPDIPIRQQNADLSCKKKEKKQLNPSHCEVLTRKRKRGTEGRSSPKRENYQDLQSLPPGSQEIATSNETRKVRHQKGKNKKDSALVLQPKIGDDRLMNTEENNEEPTWTERERKQNFHGSDDWTEEQDVALRKAYFSARPSPHFWKRVSKLVPGRSAEECFNRIHADLPTPTPIAPRSRTCKAKFSPLANFSLSDPELPNLLEPAVGMQRTSKQKSLAAQKTVRHLMQKHCLIDHAHEADHFSIFESSPSALQLNISFEDSPGTPHSCMNSGSLLRFSASSSGQKKPFSRLKTKPDEPSPGVLKPVKNVILHEKYIDQLSRREGTRRPRRKTPGSKAADSVKAHSEQKAGDLKAAKNALISEATDFISHFKKLQANSLAHVIENSEDDDGTEGD